MDKSNKTRAMEPVKMKSNNKSEPQKKVIIKFNNNNIRPLLPLALMYDEQIYYIVILTISKSAS